MPETLFLTTNLIDRFLEKKRVSRRNLQLVRCPLRPHLLLLSCFRAGCKCMCPCLSTANNASCLPPANASSQSWGTVGLSGMGVLGPGSGMLKFRCITHTVWLPWHRWA